MVKRLFISIFIIVNLYSQNIYEKSCVECHKSLPASLQRMFMNYLLVYSGERNVKVGLFHYIRYPHRDTSVMSKLFIDTIGVKKAIPRYKLSDRELKKAIDIYWEKYKVIGKIK